MNIVKKILNAILHPEIMCNKLRDIKRSKIENQLLDELFQSLNNLNAGFPEKTDKRIVIGLVRNGLFYNTFAALIGFFFRQKGFKIEVVIDDDQLLHLDMLRNGLHSEQATNDFINRMTKRAATALPNQSNISFHHELIQRVAKKADWVEFKTYSQLLAQNPFEPEETNKQFKKAEQGKISELVEASHRRFFGGRDFDSTNLQHLHYAKLSIKNEATSKAVAKALLRETKPALYITLDGIYTSFGTIFKEMKAAGVPALIFQPNGFHDRGIYISDGPFSTNNICPDWDEFVAEGYTNSIRQQAKQFMDARMIQPDYQPSQTEFGIVKKISSLKKANTKVIGLFPNVTWDGAIAERNTIFNSLADWLLTTIQWSKENNVLLVIREHPTKENIYNKYESVFSWLRELMPELDSQPNLVLIDGLTKCRSHYLIRECIDCNVVYNGTLGIETAYMGYPIVYAGNAPYSNKDCGWDPKSRQEYFNVLLKLSPDSATFKLKHIDIMESALRTAAFQFIKTSYYCPIMPKKQYFALDSINMHIRYWSDWELSINKLDPSKNQEWQQTISRISKGLEKNCAKK